MTTVQVRKKADGTLVYDGRLRRAGVPARSKGFSSRVEAQDWCAQQILSLGLSPYQPRRLMSVPRRGTIYVLEAEGFGVKIGATCGNVYTRLSCHQASCPIPLILKGTFQCEDVYKMEKQVLKGLCLPRLHGEWFKASYKEIKAVFSFFEDVK